MGMACFSGVGWPVAFQEHGAENTPTLLTAYCQQGGSLIERGVFTSR